MSMFSLVRAAVRIAMLAALAFSFAMAGCKDGSSAATSSTTTASAAATPAPTPSASIFTSSSASSVAPSPSASAAPSTAAPAPEGMVYIAGAAFEAVMGDGSKVRTEVRGFYFDKIKVTNAAYKKCYDDKACVFSPGGPLDFLQPKLAAAPMTWVSQSEAQQYCRAVGKRLPTDAEWELAARGSEGRVYPWGNEEPAKCFPPACSPVRNETPEGLVGMAGVMWEMSDAQACYVKADPKLCTMKAAVVHGGAWNSSASSFKVLEVHNSSGIPPSTISFRCAKDAP